MKNFCIIILIILIMSVLIQFINVKKAIKSSKERNKNSTIYHNTYSKKSLMTDYESYFYHIFVELENELGVRIHPQVNLASILNKENNHYYINELFRNIDFGIFSQDYNELLLLIEINDKSHNTTTRKKRDKKVEAILRTARIKLIKFYSIYPNEKEYVKNRIREEIIKVKTNP